MFFQLFKEPEWPLYCSFDNMDWCHYDISRDVRSDFRFCQVPRDFEGSAHCNPGGICREEAIKDILKIDPDAKCIVCSGYSDDPVMANYGEYGFKGIINKPFKMDDLQDVLSQVLEN